MRYNFILEMAEFRIQSCHLCKYVITKRVTGLNILMSHNNINTYIPTYTHGHISCHLINIPSEDRDIQAGGLQWEGTDSEERIVCRH